MKLAIQGLSELRARLERLRPDELVATALAEQAEHLAQTIRDSLSEPQGAGGHDIPQLRTGALRDSIGATASGLEAAIGSDDPAAAPQELGTVHLPPRPFLAPAAATAGETIARTLGQTLATALRGETPAPATNAPPAASAAPPPLPSNNAPLRVVQRRTYPVPAKPTAGRR